MKKLFLLICVASLLLSCSDNKSNDEETLRHLKTVLWPEAYREQDTRLLDNILSDEFQMIDATGNWSNKENELEYIKNNKPSYDSFNYDIRRLDIFDDHTAVISGIGKIVNLANGERKITKYHSSNVLIKRNNEWKAISSHVSGVKSDQ